MNIEQAIDILKNSIADYVIGEYCEKCADNKICDARNEDCYYQQAIDIVVTAYEKEKEKNKELSSQIDEHVYNGCDYELCNKKWVKKIKALMEKEDKLFFETKDVRHANRYKAYKELIKEE